MTDTPKCAGPRRVTHRGVWLDGYTLTAVSGGALLTGGREWHPDGAGHRPSATGAAAFFDASTNDWVPLPPMPAPRVFHTAVALPDGRALLLGGAQSPDLMASTLFFEPERRGFREGPLLHFRRVHPAAVVLSDGAVLVLGSEFDEDGEPGTRAELLKPGADRWESAGRTVGISQPGPLCACERRVILAAGRERGGFAIYDGTILEPPLSQHAELWEPEDARWSLGAPPSEARDAGVGVTLSDGRVLVVGGSDQGRSLKTAELWEPRTGRWSPTGSLAVPRAGIALIALPQGRAAVSGGLADDGPASDSVEIWDPTRGHWVPGAPLAVGRAGHQVVPVGFGRFLVVGNSRVAGEANPETTWELWSAG